MSDMSEIDSTDIQDDVPEAGQTLHDTLEGMLAQPEPIQLAATDPGSFAALSEEQQLQGFANGALATLREGPEAVQEAEDWSAFMSALRDLSPADAEAILATGEDGIRASFEEWRGALHELPPAEGVDLGLGRIDLPLPVDAKGQPLDMDSDQYRAWVASASPAEFVAAVKAYAGRHGRTPARGVTDSELLAAYRPEVGELRGDALGHAAAQAVERVMALRKRGIVI